MTCEATPLGVDFDSIPVLVDESVNFHEPPPRPRTIRTDRSRSRASCTGQSLVRQAKSQFPNLRPDLRPPSSANGNSVSIKFDDDLEMIVSDLGRPQRTRTVQAPRAIRPDLPALYLEVCHSRTEHCSSCHQRFTGGLDFQCFFTSFHLFVPTFFWEKSQWSENVTRGCRELVNTSTSSGDLRVGFMMEPNLVPQWVHLSCSRRARLQSVGKLMASDPDISMMHRQQALNDLGRSSRNARDIQPWNYLRSSIHQWSAEVVHRTEEEVSTQEKEIAEILTSLPCVQLEANRDICAICHQTMAEGEIVCNLPCGHFYHVGCIDAWLRIRTTCPLDNREIRPKDVQISNVGCPASQS